MKQFLSKNGIWLLLIAVFVTVTMAALSAYGSGIAMPIQNAVGVIASPFRTAAASVTSWIDGRIRFSADYDRLKDENAELKQEIARLQGENRQAQADSAENKRLRALLNLRPQQYEPHYESAKVVDAIHSNWTRTITLNKGTSMDIAPKDCVITAEGYLVGTVTEVGTNWCTVLTVIDTDYEMGAVVFRSGSAAIASGSFNLMAEGLLRLNYISSDEALLNGDLVLTSGLGGYYPPNIVIGTVEEVFIDDSGAMDYAILRPSADLDNLTEVFVITDFTVVE